MFSGLVFHVPDTGGVSAGDRDRVWAMVTWHGGRVVAEHADLAVTHVVTCRRVTGGQLMVTPDWVVDSIKRKRLQNTDEYEEFLESTHLEVEAVTKSVNNYGNDAETASEQPCNDDGEETSVKNKGQGEKQLISKARPTEKSTNSIEECNKCNGEVKKPATVPNFVEVQNKLIKAYLKSLDKEDQILFYKLSTAEQRKYVVEKGLIIKIVNGDTLLSDFQTKIIEKSEQIEQGVVDSKTEEEPCQEEEQKVDQIKGDVSQCVKKIDKSEEEEKEDMENNSRLAQLNLTPRIVKPELVLSAEDKRAMARMGRQQRHLYLQQLGRSRDLGSPVSSPRTKVLARAEGKLNSPQMRTPGKAASVSPAVVSSPLARGPGCSVVTPSTRQEAEATPRSHKKRLSSKICLLGCKFLIVGYQDREEAEHVPKWSHVIERHGGEVADTLTEAVTHVIAPDLGLEVACAAVAQGARVVTAHWLNDVITLKRMVAPWRGVHFPLPAPASRHSGDVLSLSADIMI